MTKKTIVIIVVVVAVLGLIGVATSGNESNVNKTNSTSTNVPSGKSKVDMYADRLGATSRTEAYYTMVGAKDGAKYDLNGKTVEIYEFDGNKVADGLRQLSNDGVEVRRIDNTVFVFHDYPEDSAEVDNLIKDIK